MDTITVCMGSSCFGRGNSTVAEVITKFIQEHKLEDKVEVKGSLCMAGDTYGSICAQGPNILINDKLIQGVTVDTLAEIITRELGLTL